jgi:hypothetical protein
VEVYCRWSHKTVFVSLLGQTCRMFHRRRPMTDAVLAEGPDENVNMTICATEDA